nr:DUF5361 domain-containing protein [uncultured Dysosmobacter sp.]
MGDMVHITTKSGLELDVCDAADQDTELLAACRGVQGGTGAGLALPKLLRLLLTPEAIRALYDHVREGGRVRYTALAAELVDIIDQLPGKRKIVALAGMLATDENALACDLAETYHILDWRTLPVRTVATFAVGLSEDSRIKMLIRGAQAPTTTILTAAMIDRLSLLWWAQTKDAQRGRGRPKMLLDMLAPTEAAEPVDAPVAYGSAADFNEARKRILKGG